jgi:thioredoxin-like negative regulator of GroEL
MQTQHRATPATDADQAVEKPRLVFFHSERSGPSRRVEGFLAQVLQRRGNHETFRVLRVSTEQRPDLAVRFGVDTIPTLIVLDGASIGGTLTAPRGCEQIETFLAPWLR